MIQKLFLSHAHQDQELANVIANILSRITLQQLNVWFSSDDSASGGIQPGKLWLDEIRSRLKDSKAILVLVTPSSINKPWLLFESGFGAANPNCEVIPICIGLSTLRDVPFPLAMYQCYQLADYESLSQFINKLLNKYEINFDEEMFKPILTNAIGKFTKYTSNTQNNEIQKSDITILDLSKDIKEHLDRRIRDVVQLQSDYFAQKPLENKIDSFVEYEIKIVINFSDLQSEQYLQIRNSTTVQNILDNIYSLLHLKVEAFTYLQKWILREKYKQLNLVIREVGQKIPASCIFTPNSSWEVIELDKPYSALDSSDYERWYSTKIDY